MMETDFDTLKRRILSLLREGYDTAEKIEEAEPFEWLEVGIALSVLKHEGKVMAQTRHGVTHFSAITTISTSNLL